MSYETGQELRIKFTGTVGDKDGPNSTTRVTEADGSVHYLFISSQDSRDILLPGAGLPKPAPGEEIDVDFTARAEANSRFYPPPESTRTVKSGPDPTGFEYTHYVSAGSPSVAPAGAPEEDSPRFTDGQKIRVRFAGTVGGETGELACTLVRESGSGTVHYLFLSDWRTLLAAGEDAGRAPQAGDVVTFDFTATVGRNGDMGYPDPLTVVRTEFNHLLDLSSPAVQPDGADGPESKPVRSTDDVINSKEVAARIEALARMRAETPNFTVTRDRTGEEVGSFRTDGEARYFITENDFNPDRFTVAKAGLNTENQREADALTALDQAGQAVYGSRRWTEEGVTARPGRYYDADFARQLTASRLDIPSYRLDEWPFDEFDWDEAASRELNANYLVVYFEGQGFWAPPAVTPG